jgi:chemotaxis protein CheX
MDATVINTFEQATAETVKKIGASDVKPGKAFLGGGNTPSGDISVITELSGDATGSWSVIFSDACICKIVGDQKGEQCMLADEEVAGCVRDISGAILESALSSLESKGLKIIATSPTVVFGKDPSLGTIRDTPVITIPFSVAAETFFMQLSIRTKPDKPSQSSAGHAAKEQIQSSQASECESGEKGYDQSNPSVIDKTALLKKRLNELYAIRDDILKQLQEKPFMERSQRMQMKKTIPLYDAKIKRVKMDLMALEMIAKVSKDSLDNPVIPKHYQHYENKKH